MGPQKVCLFFSLHRAIHQLWWWLTSYKASDDPSLEGANPLPYRLFITLTFSIYCCYKILLLDLHIVVTKLICSDTNCCNENWYSTIL